MHNYSLPQLEEYVKQGLLRKSEKDDLVLYGYTEKCTFDREWNYHTRVARGLIFHKGTGKLIAKPFPKFFNLGETEETMLKNLPNDQYVAMEKVDGSLGIIYHHNGKWNVATRGSLHSDQAKRGEQILKKYDLSGITTNTTILAEIIYPENKIIINYGDKEELVILGAYDRDTEIEWPVMALQRIAQSTGMPIATVYYHSIEDMVQMQKYLPRDKEGFVIRFDNGLRVKIKGAEYMALARLLANISPLALWETMKEGYCDRTYLQQLPEEFRKEYEPIAKRLEEQFNLVWNEIIRAAALLPTLDAVSPEGKKQIGLFLQDKRNNVPHAKAMFPFLTKNQKALDNYIMKFIRPTGNAMKGIE